MINPIRTVAALVLGFLTSDLAIAQAPRDLRRTALTSTSPSDEIVRLDIDGDGRPDILERWWNGKRVRWLDENGDMSATDTRGDQVADVLQVDMNGDGTYDGVTDQSVKWADNDGDGRPDLQAWSTQPPKWEPGAWSTSESHWMLFLDVEKDGVLGWQDWTKFNFGESNWDYTGTTDWLPDYNGNAIFLKIHRPPQALPDPRLNWENPFAFYDFDNDGLTEMGMRWLDPQMPVKDGLAPLSGVLNEAFATFDLDNDSSKGNEIDYDMSLRGAGGPGVPYTSMMMKYPALKGNPKFDALLPVGQLAPDRRAGLHAARQELRRVLQRRLDHHVLRLRRGRRRPPVGTGGDPVSHPRVRRARGHRHLVHVEVEERELREPARGARGRASPGSAATRRPTRWAIAASSIATTRAAASSTSACSTASCTSPARNGAPGPSIATASTTAGGRRRRRSRSRRRSRRWCATPTRTATGSSTRWSSTTTATARST